MAHAREDIPSLLAEVEHLRARVAGLPIDQLWRLYNDFPYRYTDFSSTFEEIFEWLLADDMRQAATTQMGGVE
jgi:hypothetical protein